MTAKNSFVCKIFLPLKISGFSLFFYKNFNPHPRKKSPPLFHQPPLKVEVLWSSSFLKLLQEVQSSSSRKRDAYYERNQWGSCTPAIPERQDEEKCASINTGSNVIIMCTIPVKIKGTSGNKVICTYALLDSYSQGAFILDQLRDHLYPWQRNISHHQNNKRQIQKSTSSNRRSASFRY